MALCFSFYNKKKTMAFYFATKKRHRECRRRALASGDGTTTTGVGLAMVVAAAARWLTWMSHPPRSSNKRHGTTSRQVRVKCINPPFDMASCPPFVARCGMVGRSCLVVFIPPASEPCEDSSSSSALQLFFFFLQTFFFSILLRVMMTTDVFANRSSHQLVNPQTQTDLSGAVSGPAFAGNDNSSMALFSMMIHAKSQLDLTGAFDLTDTGRPGRVGNGTPGRVGNGTRLCLCACKRAACSCRRAMPGELLSGQSTTGITPPKSLLSLICAGLQIVSQQCPDLKVRL